MTEEKCVAIRHVKKGEILSRRGEVAGKAFLVISGLLRSYLIDPKGKEHIFMFAPAGWTIADQVSNAFQTPSDLFIDALEDSEVQVLDHEIFETFLNGDFQLTKNQYSRLFKRIAVLQKRVLMLMASTAWDRYQDFLETYPEIAQRVPQKMVASYLGITPEALSKIRGDMAKQK